MLDTFRKRDPVRNPGAPAVSAARPGPIPQSRLAAASSETRAAALLPAATPSGEQPPAPSAVAPESLPRAAAAQPRASGGAARLIVGPDIKLKGAEITDCDTLIVEGQVEASMHSRVIEVDEQGIFRGNVQVEIADIRGRFEGELTAHKQLMVRASGRIAGKIRYGKIQIDEGGELSGDVASAHAEPRVLCEYSGGTSEQATPGAKPATSAQR
jgi:cytoskeletal protein CcmA (bactofilin family)